MLHYDSDDFFLQLIYFIILRGGGGGGVCVFILYNNIVAGCKMYPYDMKHSLNLKGYILLKC